MKVATGVVLLCLLAVAAETTTKAAMDTTIVKGTHDGISTHNFSTRSITSGHTIPERTTKTSATSTHNTPTTTIMSSAYTTRITILETTKPIFTTTTTTTTNSRTSTTRNSRPCQNGGYDDGIKCICDDLFYGPLCENIIDRVVVGTTAETTVKVELRFENKEFNENLTNDQSNEYKEFEKEFKRDMKIVYGDIPGYRDVWILSIRPGSVIVDHEVIVDISYSASITVTKQYENILQDVEKELVKIVCGKIEPIRISDCISDTIYITEGLAPKSEEELCSSMVPPGFQDFYEAQIVGTALYCVSYCDVMSKKYFSCEDGTCQLLNNTGPHCLCPRTDLYIYTSSHCNGKILKSGLYGGIGAAIGVLLIISCVVFILVIRKKKENEYEN